MVGDHSTVGKLLNGWFSYLDKQGSFPGLQVTLRNKSEIIFSGAYGLSDIRSGQKFTSQHSAQIASQSKALISAIVLWLASRGVLKLNDPVSKYLPEFNSHKDKRFRKIQILHLLSHRSGMMRDSYESFYWAGSEFPTSSKVMQELLSKDLVAAPGKFTKYSNLGYAVLGLMIERVTKLSLDQNWKLMTANRYKTIGFASHFPKSAVGYLRDQTGFKNFKKVSAKNSAALTAACGASGSTEELSDFFLALYCGNGIIPAKFRRILLSKKWKVLNLKSELYGLGTIFSKSDGMDLLGHSGGLPGFSSQTWINRKKQIVCSLITNVSVSKTFEIIESVNELIEILSNNFSKSELRKVCVSKPMKDNYSSTIYVVGKNTALAFPLGDWQIAKKVIVYQKVRGQFQSKTVSGYGGWGEPVYFDIKNNNIRSVTYGGFQARPLD